MDVVKRFQYHKLTIIKTIGKGTYGNVYLCRRENMYTIVKDIEINMKIQNHEQDTINEVKIISSLRHPNIITFYDCYFTENNVMISMEFASKGNLAEHMHEKYPKHLKQQEILFYFSQILLGVNYMHRLNIIHRDLKAENILMTGTDGILLKIGDFGISKMLASAKKTSTVIGTPYYLAPELCDGKPYDTKSDIWALGCLLYEMCTHNRAFEAETLVGLVKAITSGNFHPIDLTMYDRGVQELIDLMLIIPPEKRPNVEQIMAKQVILPLVYTVLLDAGDEERLYDDFNRLKC